MKKIVEVSYQCSVCKENYGIKKCALKCEHGTKEPKKFHKGDFVKTVIKLINVGTGKPANHYCQGKITSFKLTKGSVGRSVPPAQPQKEYGHIWIYEFKCVINNKDCSAFSCDLKLKKQNR